MRLDPRARQTIEARRVAWDGPARDVRPRPSRPDGFRDSSRDTVKPWEIDLTGRLALSAAVHRFSGSNAHVLAAFGVTPAYMRESHRGFSTFEFQLGLGSEVQAGDPLVVRSALVHVGNSSLRFFHTMLDERNGVEVASLEQSGVHFDQDLRRPAAPPRRAPRPRPGPARPAFVTAAPAGQIAAFGGRGLYCPSLDLPRWRRQ